MLITADQRESLEALIDLSARRRGLRHEHDNPKDGPALAELVAKHKAVTAERTAAAETVERLRTDIAELSAAIDKQTGLSGKKTAELNAGTGLTSRDLVTLQHEIAGHGDRVAELEEAELGLMEELETAESELLEIETRLAEVTAAGRTTQASIKERTAAIAAELTEVEEEERRLKSQLPGDLVRRFEHNVAQGGPGAAILGGPHCQACGQEISGMIWTTMLGGDVNETYECEECEAVLLRRG
ncbi:putative nucleic acid-binding Zn-ribbon protein [Brevibacterium sanguinis]|uniref:Nucleic acid-binding Zn-ribbon protein n=2 Tax=Brevibacterium TaxID=1696 RepID=A0ABX9GTA7_9MICO|nr:MULTISPECIES: hypothetical protein [Brevibacterium]RBP64776.1 putative nucleic acid-binding Zn-ribbon protein [Brevibacterium sanguinis]RBP71581.1 putative nucleic acid-binding Zn-ribbon protein [Brevibacterium celere]